MGRVLEFGTMRDVRWLQRVYGDERIHEFFREADARRWAAIKAFFEGESRRLMPG